jgi:hypothetical protein
MLLLSNRGNLNGPSDYANQPVYLQKAIDQGFLIKTDLWVFPKLFATGTDSPLYPISGDLLKNALVEARNLNALEFLLKSGLHGFYRGNSDIVFSSKGHLISFGPWMQQAIIMNPEDHTFELLLKSAGVCTDFAANFTGNEV